MANRWLDSIAHYATADISQKYPTAAGTSTVNATGGRFGGPALQAAANSGSTFPVVLDNQATWFFGVAMKAGSALTSQVATLATLLDAGTPQVTIIFNSNGTITALRGDTNGTVLGTSTATINLLAYPFIEAKVVVNNTTGAVKVWANETVILDLTGLNTRATANNQANEVRLRQTSAVTINWCDFYVNDGTGADNNTQWGDTRVDRLLPTANGNYTAWAANGAASLFDCVDDAAPNGDTDYISSSTVGQKASFVMGDIPAGATPRAVQWLMSGRKDDAGTRTVAALLRNAGVDAVGVNQNLSAAYTYYRQNYDKDPTDNATWTAAKVNSLEAGVSEVA